MLATARVDELIQAGPVRWLHALLAVRTGEGADRTARLVELDRESACLGVEGLAVGRGWTGFAVRFGQRQVAQRGDLAEQDERVAILEVDRRQLAPVVGERFGGATRNADHVSPLPGAGIEHQAAAAGAARPAEAQQAIAQLIARRGNSGIDEALLVLPLRHGLPRGRGGNTFVRAPGVLS